MVLVEVVQLAFGRKCRRWIEVGRHCVVFVSVRGFLGWLKLLSVTFLAFISLWLNF